LFVMAMRAGAVATAATATAAGIVVFERQRRKDSALARGSETSCESSVARAALPFDRKAQLAERLTLKSVARCMSADYKAPRLDMSERVRRDCGEDAFFVAEPTLVTAAVGIADGVGGWSGQGIDPALFAWELMNRCQDVAEHEAPPAADPRRLLESGFELLRKASGGAPVGSSTACVASLDRLSGELRVANLGDSGAFLVRGGGDCVLESKAQQHRFNCPYQLMVAPAGYGGGDDPKLADVYAAKVQEGDLLVLATDGVLDNVSREQLLDVATEMRSAGPEAIAERLVHLARTRARGGDETPFSLAARAAGYRHVGGKPDDITVVVARVERAAVAMQE